MSKKAKALAKQRRLQKKRAKKAAQKAEYEGWKAAGENSKSKRFTAKLRKRLVKNEDHPIGPCGNIGCKKCNPKWFNLKTPCFLHMDRAA